MTSEPSAGVDVRPVLDTDLPALAAFATPLQRAPTDHVAYLAEETDAVAAELVTSTWRVAGVVAVEDGRTIGWLIGDVDEQIGRVWWFGPFVRPDAAWEPVADALLDAARARLPRVVTEEEMAVDEHHVRAIHWAPRHGFAAGTGSSVALLRGDCGPPVRPVRLLEDADRDPVAALHDALFPGTHTGGRLLVDGSDDRHVRLVVEIDGRLAGYVAVELQSDGGGYIDYVGVDPAFRRRGLGADLVRAGVGALRRMGAVQVDLTVRDDAAGARELYASLGFEIGRRLVPLRRGFDLG